MTFSRRDVLLRHLRSVHQFEGRAKRSVQRSCFRCVEKKLKCERTKPCRACYRSDAMCEYPSPEESEGELFGSGHGDTEMSDVLQGGNEIGRRHSNEPATSAVSPVYSQRNGAFQNGLVESMATPDSLPGESMMPQTDRTYETTGPTGFFTALDSGSTIASSVEMTFDSVMPEMEASLYQGSFAITPSSFELMQPSFRTGGLDWLGVHIDDGTHDPGFNIGGGFDASRFAVSHDPVIPGIGSTLTDDAGQPGPDPDWVTRDHPPLRPRSSQQPSLPWPFDQGKDSVLHQYKLPPLHEVLSDNWRTNQPAQPTLVDGFVHILSGSRLPQLPMLRENEHIRAFHDLQRLVDSYFTRFHDIQAIIHKPTWDMASCPTVLLTAMACLGAMLSDSKADAELSQKLSDVCSTMITWMVRIVLP